MSRPRKANLNDVVRFRGTQTGTVVEYRDKVKWGRYLVIRTDSLGRNPFGPAIWVDSTEIDAVLTTSKRPGIIYRANQRLEDRGCTSQCCFHVRGFQSEPSE